MLGINNISAVFFDMDGTLVDSEPYTALSVMALCRAAGFQDVKIDCTTFDGLSWGNIALAMVDQAPQLDAIQDIPGRLHVNFHDLLQNNPLPLINQARETMIAAR